MTETSPPQHPAALTWDELDQLADWTVGELTGPAAHRVAGLVRTDPRWAAAYAGLVRTEPAVRASLQAAAFAPEPMPDDVAARLREALRAAPTAGPPRVLAQPGSRRPPAHRPPARPGRSRSTRRRPLAIAAAAVLVLVAGLSGITLLGTFLDDFGMTEAPADLSGRDPVEGAPTAPVPSLSPPFALPTPPGNGAAEDSPSLLVSGRDYQAATLTDAAARPTVGSSFDDIRSVIPELAALATPDGFDRCLAAVATLYPGTAVAADFASYQGTPAVILLIDAPTSMVVAVGPKCGSPGADVLAAVELD
jgi:hypothetical protein